MTEISEQRMNSWREDLQKGREFEVAWNVLSEYLDGLRNNVLVALESPGREITQIETETYVLTLRIIKGFREKCRAAITSGEIAAKNLKESEE